VNDTRDQIAKLIYDLNPEIQPWDGDPFEFHEPRAGYKKKLAYRQADAVIELLQ
jgi:hypothetical protein